MMANIETKRTELESEIEAEYKKKYEALLRDIKEEFPEFGIIDKKTSRFSQLLGKLAFWNKSFNSSYITTIGPKIFVHSGYSDAKYKVEGKENRNLGWFHPEYSYKKRYDVMVHERIHMRQEQKLGLTVWIIIFGLIPFPVKLAYFRKKWESQAYETNIYIALKEKGREYVLSEKYIKYMLDQFCGPYYMWTWYSERDIIKWILKTVRDIESGRITWSMLANRERLPKGARTLKAPKLLKWLYPEDFRK